MKQWVDDHTAGSVGRAAVAARTAEPAAAELGTGWQPSSRTSQEPECTEFVAPRVSVTVSYLRLFLRLFHTWKRPLGRLRAASESVTDSREVVPRVGCAMVLLAASDGLEFGLELPRQEHPSAVCKNTLQPFLTRALVLSPTQGHQIPISGAPRLPVNWVGWCVPKEFVPAPPAK